jgi:hypothetical protein
VIVSNALSTSYLFGFVTAYTSALTTLSLGGLYNVVGDFSGNQVYNVNITGIQGGTGSQGARGFTGFTGFTGAVGVTGSQGAAGTNSGTGATGVTGWTGIQGAQGLAGVSSATGASGSQGHTGTTGAQGAAGTATNTGATGATGIAGTITITTSNTVISSNPGIGGSASFSITNTNMGWVNGQTLICVNPTTSNTILGYITSYSGNSLNIGNIFQSSGTFSSSGTWTIALTGIPGSTGTTGTTGAQGLQGTASGTGATGSPGTTGFTGAQGLHGTASGTGATGAQGAAGFLNNTVDYLIATQYVNTPLLQGTTSVTTPLLSATNISGVNESLSGSLTVSGAVNAGGLATGGNISGNGYFTINNRTPGTYFPPVQDSYKDSSFISNFSVGSESGVNENPAVNVRAGYVLMETTTHPVSGGNISVNSGGELTMSSENEMIIESKSVYGMTVQTTGTGNLLVSAAAGLGLVGTTSGLDNVGIRLAAAPGSIVLNALDTFIEGGGLIVKSGGNISIASGNLSITAGGIELTAGGIALTAGGISLLAGGISLAAGGIAVNGIVGVEIGGGGGVAIVGGGGIGILGLGGIVLEGGAGVTVGTFGGIGNAGIQTFGGDIICNEGGIGAGGGHVKATVGLSAPNLSNYNAAGLIIQDTSNQLQIIGLSTINGLPYGVGATGSQGATGVTGSFGDTGSQGFTGSQGYTGIQGPTGSQGIPGGSSSFYNYQADNGTTPGSGHITWSNFATQIASTYIRVNHIDQNGDDIDIFLNLIQQGNKLIIQDQDQSNNYQTWLVNGTPIPNTGVGWAQFPIALISSSGSANFTNNQQIIFAVISSVPGATGAQGFTGSQGATGFTGFTGFTGSQGTQGNTGRTGAQGLQGNQGNQGSQGSQGNVGLGYDNFLSASSNAISLGIKNFTMNLTSSQTAFAVGTYVRAFSTISPSNFMEGTISSFSGTSLSFTSIVIGGSGTYTSWGFSVSGLQGGTGSTGFTGSAGAQGAQGNQGNTGRTGAQGAQGNQGNQGNQGTQGNTGRTGAQGAIGNQGNQGAQGATGFTGAQGNQGNQGNQGFQGFTGFTGSGFTGAQGAPGAGSSDPNPYFSSILVSSIIYTSTIQARQFQTTDNNAVLGLNAFSFGGGVAIGNGAYANATDAIAIGVAASNVGAYSIAIGTNIGNSTAVSEKSIILNADVGFEPIASQVNSCYVNPIRVASTITSLYYNNTTKEVTFGSAPTSGASIPSNPTFSTLLVSSIATVNNLSFTTNNTTVGSNAIVQAGSYNVALGYSATVESGSYNVAIGYGADIVSGVGSNAIAIGHGINVPSNNVIDMGYFNVNSYGAAVIGSPAICIGNNIGANGLGVSNSNIVLNATMDPLGGQYDSAFYVKPVRNASTINALYYNTTNAEVSYAPLPPPALTFSTFTINSTMTPVGQNDGSYTYSLPWAGINYTNPSIVIGSVLDYDYNIPNNTPYAGLPLLSVGPDIYNSVNNVITFTVTQPIDSFATIAVQVLKF